jgi:hypothetical protein
VLRTPASLSLTRNVVLDEYGTDAVELQGPTGRRERDVDADVTGAMPQVCSWRLAYILP